MSQAVHDGSSPSRGISISSLRDAYYVVFRHRVAALVVLVLGAALSLVVALRPTFWRSDAKLLVRAPAEVVPSTTHDDGGLRADLRSELEILTSHELLAGVARELRASRGESLVADDPEFEAFVTELAERLTVRLPEESRVITLSLDWEKPERAREALELLVSHYLRKHAEVHQGNGTLDYLQRLGHRIESELATAEATLQDFLGETGVADVSSQRKLLADRVGALELERRAAVVNAAGSEAKVARLEGLLKSIPGNVVLSQTTGATGTASDRLRERLYELYLKEQELRTLYQEDSRPVQDVRSQIEEARALLDAEQSELAQVTEGINPNHQQIALEVVGEQARLAATEAGIEMLDHQLDAARLALGILEESQVQMQRLETEIEARRIAYERYLANVEEARIQLSMQEEGISNISVIQRPTLPMEPIGPGRVLLFLFGLVVACVFGFGSTFVLEFFDDTVDTPDALEERLGLPVYASLPLVREWPIAHVPPEVREPFRELRERVVLSDEHESGAARFIAVTGARRGAGATTVASGLAASLALLNEGPVMLVDLDVEEPRASLSLIETGQEGVADALHGEGTVHPPVHALGVPGLHFVPAGSKSHLMVGRLDPNRTMALLREWADGFAYVVLDLPPVTAANAFGVLARECDDRFIVVESGRTRWQVIERTRDAIRVDSGNVGAVLNKRRFPIPSWLYRTL